MPAMCKNMVLPWQTCHDLVTAVADHPTGQLSTISITHVLQQCQKCAETQFCFARHVMTW